MAFADRDAIGKRLEKIITECAEPVGEKPWWMGWGQWDVDACRCVRPRGHEGPCDCGMEHGE